MGRRQYSKLGEVIDELARKRHVRGPYRIANHIRTTLESGPSGVAVAKWMYGDTTPKPERVAAFADALELNGKERTELAFAYTYGEDPPPP